MNNFWFGWFSCWIANNIYQDMNGKELYIKKINEYWMDTDYYVWIILWVIIAMFVAFNRVFGSK